MVNTNRVNAQELSILSYRSNVSIVMGLTQQTTIRNVHTFSKKLHRLFSKSKRKIRTRERQPVMQTWWAKLLGETALGETLGIQIQIQSLLILKM